MKVWGELLGEQPLINSHLIGEISGNGQAVGCHLNSAVDNVRVRLQNPQPSGFPTYYSDGKLQEAAIDIWNGTEWISKNAKSIFFPHTWTNNRILMEVAFVKSNPANKITDRIWVGISSDGITKIRIEYTGADLNDLTFQTVYPKFN